MSGNEDARLRRVGFAWLAATIGAAVAVQRTLLVRAKEILLADPDVRAKSLGAGDALRALGRAVGGAETAALLVFAALLAVAVVAQTRRRTASRFVAAALESRGATALLVAMLAVGAHVWLFDKGPLLRHDAHAQTGVVALVAENLRHGEPISWSFRWYGGYPLVAAYGTAVYVLAGLATIATGSLEWGVKLVLLAGGVGAALATARLASRLGCRPSVAVLAGVAPLLSFQHTHTLAWSGKFPEALLYALFPLALAEAWPLALAAGRDGRRAAAGFALVGGAMALVHPPLGALGCVAAGAFALVAAWGARPARPMVRTLLRLAAAAALVLALVAPIALGVIEERGWVLLGRGGLHSGGVADFAPPGAGALSDLLVWRHGWTGDVHAYLGLTLVVGGFGGAAYALSRGRRPAAAALGATAVCVAMLGGGYIASRAVAYLVVLLAVGLALGLETALAERAAAGRRPFPIVAAAAAALLLDLGPTLVQAPGAANDDASRANFAQMSVAAAGARGLRLSRRGGRVGIDDTDDALDVPLDVPLGAHHYMGSNAWCAFTLGLVNEVRAAWEKDDAAAAAAMRGLAFQGVAVVGEDRRTEFGAPLRMPAGVVAGEAPGCVRLAGGSSATFGDAVEAAAPALRDAVVSAPFSLYEKEREAQDTVVRAAVRDALRRMDLRADSPRAARLLLLDADAASPLLAQGPCRGEVLETASSSGWWRTRLRIDAAGAVRLAVAWSPRLRVTVDGAAPPVPPAPDIAGGVVLALTPGVHEVEARPAPARADQAWWPTAVVGAALIVRRLLDRGRGSRTHELTDSAAGGVARA